MPIRDEQHVKKAAVCLQAYLRLRREVDSLTVKRWDDLLIGRQQAASNVDETAEALYTRLLFEYRASITELRKAQVNTAEDFNVLEVLDIRGDELRHSRMLIWLADPRSTHAQGKVGFELLLSALRLPTEYAEKDYWVEAEVVGSKSTIDVEIAARRQFLIHVENKIWSQLGEKQLEREAADAEIRARHLSVAPEHTHRFFVTLKNGPHQGLGPFKPICWIEIARVFEEFAGRAAAPPIKWFARHYADALTRLVLESRKTEEEQ